MVGVNGQDFPDFLENDCEEAARRLLGCTLERERDGTVLRVRIVETEAYDQEDPASHAYGGERKRNAVMFGPSGRLYVYFTYGMHYCINAVTGPAGYGSGVLIRAVEPVPDEANRDVFAILAKNRGGVSGTNLTNGPAKLTQALGIDMSLSGHDLRSAPLKLLPGSLRPGEAIVTSPRVGISKAKDLPRRFFITPNSYVSRVPKDNLKKSK